SNPIKIRFVCGYGAAGTSVPKKILSAVKMIIADLYENREAQAVGSAQIFFENKAVDRLLASARLWEEF
ncbi:MAG: head-tail connector protein, partial [Candidatus Omnitrophica bacterium]|nr:head-tail connector protein [Candidatus Omnitrophota bacterium]